MMRASASFQTELAFEWCDTIVCAAIPAFFRAEARITGVHRFNR